jgi:hypothetical protein
MPGGLLHQAVFCPANGTGCSQVEHRADDTAALGVLPSTLGLSLSHTGVARYTS